MPFGLTENEITRIKAIFLSYPKVEEVVIYGSRAKGNFKPGSDIDMALIGDDINLFMLNDIGNQLDDLLMPYIFDTAIYHQIGNHELTDHIKRAGITVYKKEMTEALHINSSGPMHP